MQRSSWMLMGCLLAPPLPPPTPAPVDIEAIARKYYKINAPDVDDALPRLPQIPWMGQVSNLQGEAILGATLSVRRNADNSLLAQTLTGAAGRYQLSAFVMDRSDYVEVMAEGYARWAQSPANSLPMQVVLLRAAQKPLEELAGPLSESERLWRVLELVGPPPLAEQTVIKTGDLMEDLGFFPETRDYTIFPHIGEIRHELRRIAENPAFSRFDIGRDSPATRAKKLLYEWGDINDQDLALKPPPDPRLPTLSAPTPEALCLAYSDLHFAKEGYGPDKHPPPYGCEHTLIFNDQSQARITLFVSYTHWGYAIELSAQRSLGDWHLNRAREILHYDML